MQNGICPECGGTEIYTKAGAIWGHLTGISVKIGGLWKGTAIMLDGLICAQCGHAAVRIPVGAIEQMRSAFTDDGWTRVQGSNDGK